MSTSSDATSEFKKVGTAAEKAGKDVASAFDDAGTKSEQAFAKIVNGLGKATTEAKQTIEVVGRIRQEFADVDAESLAALVNSLRKAGVEFDTIEGKAEELVATLKEADGVRLDAANRG